MTEGEELRLAARWMAATVTANRLTPGGAVGGCAAVIIAIAEANGTSPDEIIALFRRWWADREFLSELVAVTSRGFQEGERLRGSILKPQPILN